MSARYLIVNADDFGLSPGVNEAIIHCHTEGIVTSASLMVTGSSVKEAVELARQHLRLGIGLHWDVLGEAEEERPFDIKDHAAVREEFRRQLGEFWRLLGQPPTHIDSHRHLHRREPLRALFEELVKPTGVPLRGDGSVRFVGGFYAQWEWGVTDLQHVSVPALQRMLREEVSEGWTEFSCHPGYVPVGCPWPYGKEREAEVQTLTDPRVRSTIEETAISLVSYADYLDALPSPLVTPE